MQSNSAPPLAAPPGKLRAAELRYDRRTLLMCAAPDFGEEARTATHEAVR
jgi:hypothetical protein